MDELLTPTQVAAMLALELDWVKASTRSNIYDGTLLVEPWRLQRATQKAGQKADWRIQSDSVQDLIDRYKSSEWDHQERPRRKTNVQDKAATNSKEAWESLTAIAEPSSDIADLVRKMTEDHQRARGSYSDALRVVGEALVALGNAIDRR